MQTVHIMRNNLLSHLLKAEGMGVMPAIESKRGKTINECMLHSHASTPLLPLHSGAASTCAEVAKELKRPLTRKGAGGKPFTIWREDVNVTPQNPLVLTRVAKNKVGMPTISN